MMIKPIIKETDLDFGTLTPLLRVSKIVVHHTGNSDAEGNYVDDNLSAEEIHAIHKAMGWVGIGYHYVIRKDGTIERGRPEEYIGSHAYGYNWETLGIHLCGNFEGVDYWGDQIVPTAAQIESAAYLIGWLCEKYCLVPNKYNVVGHRDLMSTACPGQGLYDKLQTIRGKAIWYQQNYQGGD